MSEQDDELELQALQRELDDAFATTRPRQGFEDELWLRVQARRPFGGRLRDALSGFVQGIRAVPAVPAGAVATLLVVALGLGLLYVNGLGRGSGGEAASTRGGPLSLSQAPNHQYGGGSGTAYGRFGRLPSPLFSSSDRTPAPAQAATGAGAVATRYYGPAVLTWAGQLTLTASSVPVYRYQEPGTNAADQFASSLGAALVDRPAGFLGSYESSDYTLKVRGTVQSPPQGPAYFILSAPSLPPVASAGASPADLALLFLANHSLVPEWSYATDVSQTAGSLTKVRLLRQFGVAGYGEAYLVDVNGSRYGLEVDLDGSRPVLASGPLPVQNDPADYPVVTPDQAIAFTQSSAAQAPPGAPAVQLTHAELVYVLVAAGDHSFYEPAYLFTGTFVIGGVTYEKRLLVSAIDPSQRSS